MRTAARRYGAPFVLVAAVAAMYHRAFALDDLLIATSAALLLGAGAGTALAWRRAPALVGLLMCGAGLVAGVTALSGEAFRPDLIPDVFALFLTVGLPAYGLDQLAVVPFVVLFAAAAASVAASARTATLATIGGPAVALAVTAALLGPVGSGWWMPAVFAGASGLVLLLDARRDLSQLPPLVAARGDVRRQAVWWRPLVQFVPALLVVAGLAAALPHGRTVDPRKYVHPPTERLADLNPLALAERARRAPEGGAPFAAVDVEGVTPGRLRLAVLDAYATTGWAQVADFSITGRTLAGDPLYPVVDGDERRSMDAPTTRVRVRPQAGARAFRAEPTGGTPLAVATPRGVRFAPRAGVLLAETRGREIAYTAAPAVPRAQAEKDVTVGTFPADLARCPQSERVSSIASQLSAGTTSASERLARIENYLKIRRVYDPAAPGGQTIRSVERFLEQDFARGNLEVFVTSYALLARCAGVPVRVVVGLPAPAPGRTQFREGDVSAWVETPLAASGWVAFDPLPTPEEQRQQAQLARQPDEPDPPEPDAAEPPPPPREVAPVDIALPERSRLPAVAAAALGVAVMAVILLAALLPRRIVRRRRRAADPTAAVHAAWATVTDALVDRDIDVDGQHTPNDVARIVVGRVPLGVPRLIEGLAPIVDRARYSGVAASAGDAGTAWAYADAVVESLGKPRRSPLWPLRSPRLAITRLRTTAGVARRSTPWRGALPEAMSAASGGTPHDIPGVTVTDRIGDGATGTVFRGALASHGGGAVPVAVKVFRFGPGDNGFDERRFDWEVRVARQVSGLPHLPVVHGAGITPITLKPFIISTLYDGGTLLDRVRRGGPMTAAEAVAIAADLGFALTALHQLGVVHADVKPENVFSGPDGWVLGDLGSAWLRSSRGPAASLTPPYAAPEVWRGSSPTPASDLYSLALTILFAVTGRVPTASVTPSRDDVLDAFPDHPVMVRALEPDARRRPRSVADLVRQLRPDLVVAGRTDRLATLSLPTPTASYRRGS